MRRAAPRGKPKSMAGRRRLDRYFLAFCLAVSGASVLILIVLLGAILWQGTPRLTPSFLVAAPSPDVDHAGVGPALMGTIWVCGLCALLALPIGVATAILLEEYQPRARRLRTLTHIVQLNITNLAGVPSVVYGILGLTAFVGLFGLAGSPTDPVWEIGSQYFDQFLTEGDMVVLIPVSGRNAPPTVLTNGMQGITPSGERVILNVIGPRERLPSDEALRARTLRSDSEGGRINKEMWYHVQIPFGRSVLAGALTLMLVILPIVVIATQESLRAVPASLREGAMGLGATRWQVVWHVTLPAALPGIMTSSILAISRAIGEAAPVLIIAGIVYIADSPRHLMDDFTVLPLQIYNWAQRPQPVFHELAASGIIVLLAILLCFNSAAIIIRSKLQRGV